MESESGSLLHRDNRVNGKKNPCQGKQRIWTILAKTENFVRSRCKFPDSKGKGYCNISCGIGLPSQLCECNNHKLLFWHRLNFLLNRENIGKGI